MRRREFVDRVAGGAVVGFFGASLADLRAAGRFAAQASATQAYEYLTADQATLLDAVSAQLVPTDDTPGAREARVVRFIDHALATFLKQRQPRFKAALADFDRFSRSWDSKKLHYHQRTNADQISILVDFEKKKGESFWALRNATMAGMFSHPEHGGNAARIGWKLIGYEDRYSWVPPFGFYDR